MQESLSFEEMTKQIEEHKQTMCDIYEALESLKSKGYDIISIKDLNCIYKGEFNNSLDFKIEVQKANS